MSPNQHGCMARRIITAAQRAETVWERGYLCHSCSHAWRKYKRKAARQEWVAPRRVRHRLRVRRGERLW